MKNISIIAVFAALIIAGCGSKEETTPESATTGSAAATSGTSAGTLRAVSYDKGTKKKGDKGVCAVCMIKEGKQPAEEEAKVVMDYKDRTYIFCNEAEEAEFISDPKKYAGE